MLYTPDNAYNLTSCVYPKCSANRLLGDTPLDIVNHIGLHEIDRIAMQNKNSTNITYTHFHFFVCRFLLLRLAMTLSSINLGHFVSAVTYEAMI